MTLMEPDVTLTDYGLAIECMVLAGLIYAYGVPRNVLRFWFVAFFVALGVAALIGGTFHGFFGNQSSLGPTVLWPATLVAIGVAALALWSIGATLMFSERVANWVSWGALFAFAVYVLLILFSSRGFWIAIINYIPASMFLLVAFLVVYSRTGMSYLLVGVGGIFLTLIAATVQHTGISVHPRYFNHNALYHLIQAVALFLIYWTARVLVR
ncbi:MAG: hypothetical protein ACE5HM_04215 [Acidiferrobacterales bacterium]